MQAPDQTFSDPQDHGIRQNRVALVGASVRAAAQSAKRAGFRVISVDQFGDRDTLEASEQFINLSEIAQNIQNSQDLPPELRDCPTFVVGESDQASAIVPAIQAAGNLISAAPRVTEALKQASVLNRLCSGTNASVPTTVDFENLPESLTDSPKFSGAKLSRHLQQTFGTRRWLAKRRHSSGGMGVRWLHEISDPQQLKDSDIQRWVPGKCYGVVFVCDAEW